MRSLDVFVHASSEESFGIVLVEAMACGRPIIAGRSSGATGELLPDSDLLLSDVRNVYELMSAIVKASRTSPEDGGVIDEGLRRVGSYDIEAVAERYLACLGGIVGTWSERR
jgi:glycosyltransferase involved in cell wall biosynthesis